MSIGKESRSFLCLLVLAVLMLPASAFAQTPAPTGPTIVTINGNPLKINVAADASFQIFNVTVPGRGQMYPSSSQYGDMGVFANIGGTLYAPAFTTHGTTATGNLGTYVPWSQSSISAVQGDGSAASPFSVTVNVSGSGVTLSVVVTYVQGQNFFRIKSNFGGSRTMNVFLGADIYLASSDAGVFFVEPTLHAPGGVDCAVPPTYHILLIPLTPANRFSTRFYGTIWQQIGQGRLDNNDVPAGCVDNGAALEWDNVTAPVSIGTAVSFGEIPSAASFLALFLSVDPSFVTMLPGDSADFTVTTGHNPDSGFNSSVELSAPNLPDGMTATFDHTNIPAPGDGTAKLHLQLSNTIFPTTYRGISVVGTGADGTTAGSSFGVDVVCDPPIVTALNHPKSQTVKRGTTVTLSVKPEGNASNFTYQWYSGHAGFTSTPIANSNSPNFTTPPVNAVQEYWVRVSNACGSQDTLTATLIPVD